MKKNVGRTDAILRLAVAIGIILLYSFKLISGNMAIIILGIGTIFALTGLLRTCPIYTIMGINSCGINDKK